MTFAKTFDGGFQDDRLESYVFSHRSILIDEQRTRNRAFDVPKHSKHSRLLLWVIPLNAVISRLFPPTQEKKRKNATHSSSFNRDSVVILGRDFDYSVTWNLLLSLILSGGATKCMWGCRCIGDFSGAPFQLATDVSIQMSFSLCSCPFTQINYNRKIWIVHYFRMYWT